MRPEEVVGDDERDDTEEDERPEAHKPVRFRVAVWAKADVRRAVLAALHQVVAESFMADDSVRFVHAGSPC